MVADRENFRVPDAARHAVRDAEPGPTAIATHRSRNERINWSLNGFIR